MNAFSTLGAMWCLTLAFSSVSQVRNQDATATDPAEKLRDIVAMLRIVWDQDFELNYRKFMLGASPTVVLIPRSEMIKIAEARLDGRRRDGTTTQGLTIYGPPDIKIAVVYDDIAPLFVARSIIHEIGHLELGSQGLPRNREEARVRKTVDTAFWEKLFGPEWLQTTVEEVRKKVVAVEKKGRLYQGYTPEAVDVFYQDLGKAGARIARNPLHDQIIASFVFNLTNSEDDLVAALDADDDPK